MEDANVFRMRRITHVANCLISDVKSLRIPNNNEIHYSIVDLIKQIQVCFCNSLRSTNINHTMKFENACSNNFHERVV